MAENIQTIELARCPHCGRARPTLSLTHFWPNRDGPRFQEELDIQLRAYGGGAPPGSARLTSWGVYECTVCHRLVMAEFRERRFGGQLGVPIRDYGLVRCWPDAQRVPPEVPERARQFLLDSIESPPRTAVMGAASALDAMLKEKGYDKGFLGPRIKQAAADHLITADMEAWANEVKVVANEQRHADMDAPLPDEDEKRRTLAFAFALAEYLFVLPARIRAGRSQPPPASDSQ